MSVLYDTHADYQSAEGPRAQLPSGEGLGDSMALVRHELAPCIEGQASERLPGQAFVVELTFILAHFAFDYRDARVHLQTSKCLWHESAEHGCAGQALQAPRLTAVGPQCEECRAPCSLVFVAPGDKRIMSIGALALDDAHEGMQDSLFAHINGLFEEGPAKIPPGSFGPCHHLERFKDFADELSALVEAHLLRDVDHLLEEEDGVVPSS